MINIYSLLKLFFFLTRSALFDFNYLQPLEGFIFFFLFIVAQLHACVVSIALPACLAQGFYFAFAFFFCCF